MSRPSDLRVPAAVFALAMMTVSCGRKAEEARGGEEEEQPAEVESLPPAIAARPEESSAFTEADLDAYERGFAKEIELVRAAQQTLESATTAEERGEAIQWQWESRTAPEGARAAGLPVERYRAVRTTVNRVLETLDFQGKIEGPKSIDMERASPQMRQRLAGDPLAELPPASAAALRARLDRLARLWSEYVSLTAVAG